MGLFRSKFDKLTREDIVDAICQLENEVNETEADIDNKQKQIDDLTQKGKKEKSRDVRLFYAKKINMLKGDREQLVQRSMYLLYNIRMLNKLKKAVDDNKFFAKNAKMSLGNLLSDQKGLAKFLNKALNTRIAAENVLTDADETFKEVESAYEANENIYGMGQDDDALLAVFETEDSLDIEGEEGAAAEGSDGVENSDNSDKE